MERNWTYDSEMPIDTIMRQWPATIAVLIRHRMLCVGCPIAAFHTVSDACREHGTDEGTFVRELGDAITASCEGKLERAVR